MKKKLFVPLIFAFLLVAMIGCAKAGTETFTVPPPQEIVRTISLDEGDKVSGSINVSGGSGNDINFYVTNPNGDTILTYDRTTQTCFSFTASTAGSYTMHFDNSFTVFSSKTVTLDYTITEPIFGLPPQQFYFLVFLVIVIVASIVAFGLKRRKPATQT